MIVTKIQATRFMQFEALEVDLPEKGLVVVTGPNGSGKTTLIESISFAAYGETIRGTSPWRVGKGKEIQGSIRLEIQGRPNLDWIERKNHGDKLTFSDAPEFTTMGKAQEHLEPLLTPDKIWRRCAVFSSEDAAVFSAATDAERKNLLETILGLEKFDEALKLCRADLATLQTSKTKLDAELMSTVRLLEREQEALEVSYDAVTAQGEALTIPNVLEAKEKGQKAKIEMDKLALETRSLKDAIDAARSGTARLEAELSQSRKMIDRYANGKCPTCGQDTRSVLTQAQAEFSAAESTLQKARIGLKANEERRNKLERLEEKRRAYQKTLAESEAEIRSADQLKRAVDANKMARRAAEDAIKKLEVAVAQLSAKKDRLETELATVAQEMIELEATATVLGLRGVRSSVLAKALAGLEAVANSFVSVLAPGIRLEIKPYTERKAGHQVEAISIHIEGAGGGLGYHACSKGERGKINLAFLLALATFGESALGHCSDLYLDEAFDGLDKQGAFALAELLLEMSQTRKVMVISHDASLVEMLRPRAALRLHVENAQIQVV